MTPFLEPWFPDPPERPPQKWQRPGRVFTRWAREYPEARTHSLTTVSIVGGLAIVAAPLFLFMSITSLAALAHLSYRRVQQGEPEALLLLWLFRGAESLAPLVVPIYSCLLVWRIANMVSTRLLADAPGLVGITRLNRFARATTSGLIGAVLAILLASIRAPGEVWWRSLKVGPAPEIDVFQLAVAQQLRPPFALPLIASAQLVSAIYALLALIVFARDSLWSQRSSRSRSPLRRCELSDDASGHLLTVAHWSDLHITGSPTTPRLDRGQSPNKAFESLVAHPAAGHAHCEAVLITGDLTNAGSSDEWREFFRILPEEMRARTTIIPGNHDLNIASSHSIDAVESGDYILRQLRQIRLMAAMDLIQGDRSWVFPDDRPTLLLSDYLASVSDRLCAFARDPPRHAYENRFNLFLMDSIPKDVTSKDTLRLLDFPARTWECLFPMVTELGGGRVLAVVFDSNALGRNIVDNAFGHVDTQQLKRVARIRSEFPQARFIYLLHHHVSLPSVDLDDLVRRPGATLMNQFMVLENAEDVIAAIEAGRSSTVILHGHRHTGFMGDLSNGVQVVSAPSTTMGDEHPFPEHRDRGFFIFRLGASGQTDAKVVSREWASYAGGPESDAALSRERTDGQQELGGQHGPRTSTAG